MDRCFLAITIVSLKHRLRFILNGKMEHLTTHLHRPGATRSPLSFWGDGGIIPFEPFFYAFPGGLEKATINRTFLILPYFQEEREILFLLNGSRACLKKDLRVFRVGPGGSLNAFLFLPI
jgi:hypothetical protein